MTAVLRSLARTVGGVALPPEAPAALHDGPALENVPLSGGTKPNGVDGASVVGVGRGAVTSFVAHGKPGTPGRIDRRNHEGRQQVAPLRGTKSMRCLRGRRRDSQQGRGGAEADNPLHTAISCFAERYGYEKRPWAQPTPHAVDGGKRDAAARTARMRAEIRQSRARLSGGWKARTPLFPLWGGSLCCDPRWFRQQTGAFVQDTSGSGSARAGSWPSCEGSTPSALSKFSRNPCRTPNRLPRDREPAGRVRVSATALPAISPQIRR